MATFSNNGVNIYYEDTGEGYPLVWSHEFAGNYDSWEPQVRFFTRRYRVITYAARGYPPSDVPEDPDAYSQELAVDDLRQLLGHLGIEQAHLGGLSMGGAVVLNFGFVYPEMCRSLVVASAGSGTTDREAFLANSEAMAARLLAEGMGRVADEYTRGNTRVQLLRKDPRGWQEFRDGMAAHSAMGSALTFRGFQIKRPTIYQLEEQLKALQVPTLIMIGDEDEPCVEPSIFMKRRIPSAGLSVFPQSGHAINLEEPDLFNRTVLDFLTAVEAERWA
jgi:pimeloyl-ACP methyl ester carboxylesterase